MWPCDDSHVCIHRHITGHGPKLETLEKPSTNSEPMWFFRTVECSWNRKGIATWFTEQVNLENALLGGRTQGRQYTFYDFYESQKLEKGIIALA